MSKPNFTTDELLYIEKIMDINSSLGERPMRECAEKAMLARASGDEKVAVLLFNQFFEHGEAYLITKQIRNKIEKWRKKWMS